MSSSVSPKATSDAGFAARRDSTDSTPGMPRRGPRRGGTRGCDALTRRACRHAPRPLPRREACQARQPGRAGAFTRTATHTERQAQAAAMGLGHKQFLETRGQHFQIRKGYTGEWAVAMCDAPCKEPSCCCAAVFWCAPCAPCASRACNVKSSRTRFDSSGLHGRGVHASERHSRRTHLAPTRTTRRRPPAPQPAVHVLRAAQAGAAERHASVRAPPVRARPPPPST